MKRSEIKKRPLSDTTLENLEPDLSINASCYREKDDGNLNLYFRVHKSGKKDWQIRYKKQTGEWNWAGLGGYPETSGKFAREKARAFLSDLSKGDNPILTKQQRKQAEQEVSSNTLEKLIYEHLEGKVEAWDPETMKRNRGALELHIIPIFGKRPYASIKPKEWLDHLKAVQRSKNMKDQHNRIRALCLDIYDLAKVTGRIDYNPLEGLHKYLKKTKSENMPHVSANELPALLRAIRNYPTRNVSIGLQLLSILFPRPSELREATWDEFDLDKKLWIIPAERMKRRIEFAIPLPDQAIVLLNELKNLSNESPYLFPSRLNRNNPMSNNTFNMALKRLGYEDRQTPHGFRHIASSNWNRRYSDKSQVVEAALSHLKQGVKGVYDKEAHLEERAPMQHWWASYLDELADDSLIQFPNKAAV